MGGPLLVPSWHPEIFTYIASLRRRKRRGLQRSRGERPFHLSKILANSMSLSGTNCGHNSPLFVTGYPRRLFNELLIAITVVGLVDVGPGVQNPPNIGAFKSK